MADTKKKSTPRKGSSKKGKRVAAKLSRSLPCDIAGLALMGLALFTGFSVFTQLTGVVGQAVRMFLCGLLGLAGYAVPLVLLGAGWLTLIAHKRVLSWGKIALIVLLFVFLQIFLHLFWIVSIQEMNESVSFSGHLLAAYEFGKNTSLGMGLLGAIPAYPVYMLLGLVGSYILCAVGFIACIAVLTKLSLTQLGRKVTDSVVKTSKEVGRNAAQAKEERRARREEDIATRRKLFPGNEQGRKPRQERWSWDADGELQGDGGDKPFHAVRKWPGEEEEETENTPRRRRLFADPDDAPRTPLSRKAPKDGDGAGENGAPSGDGRPPFSGELLEPVAAPVRGHKAPVFTPLSPRDESDPEPERVVYRPDGRVLRTPELDLLAGRDPQEGFDEEAPAPWDDLPDESEEPQPKIVPASTRSENEPRTRIHAVYREEDAAPQDEPIAPPPRRAAPQPKPVQPQPPVREGASLADFDDDPEELTREPITVTAVPKEEVKYLYGHESEAVVDDKAVAPYAYPPYKLLSQPVRSQVDINAEQQHQQANVELLEETLASFGIEARVLHVSKGPAITRYELQPARGVKVSRITGLADDIALNMAAVGVRIEAPIPGKAAVGIEIANEKIDTVALREVLESDVFRKHPSKLAVALGKDIAGDPMVADLARMPHLLIAGATGSGKSVCINSLVASILYKSTPDEVKLIMIDPKVVELSVYNGIPHLLIPVVTDPKKAAGALGWAVREMDDRYKKFATTGCRDLKGYNARVLRDGEKPLPQIVVIIDELADLMMVAPGDVEDRICRLAQLARAAGIHLVIATQRPSVNVITGVIKANIPSRIAFAVSSQVDSRTILDVGGAEKLLGRGDMLFDPSGANKKMRIQGAFISDDEVTALVEFAKEHAEAVYDPDFIEVMERTDDEDAPQGKHDKSDDADGDDLLAQAVELAIDSGQISASMLQRRFRVGYARAGRLLDEMEKRKLISGFEGSKPRQCLVSREEYERIFGRRPQG